MKYLVKWGTSDACSLFLNYIHVSSRSETTILWAEHTMKAKVAFHPPSI